MTKAKSMTKTKTFRGYPERSILEILNTFLTIENNNTLPYINTPIKSEKGHTAIFGLLATKCNVHLSAFWCNISGFLSRAKNSSSAAWLVM